MKMPSFLTRFLRGDSPAGHASALAKHGAAARKADQRAKSRAFHREMRAQLGLPPIPAWEEAGK